MDVFGLIPEDLVIGISLGLKFLGEVWVLFKLMDAVNWPFKSPADGWKAVFAWLLLPVWMVLCLIAAIFYVIRGISELRF